MKMKPIISRSLEETKEIARRWLMEISASEDLNDSNEATVIGLCGPLGSGKTAFVQEVAKILGIEKPVTSPTFVLMKIYEIGANVQPSPWKRLIHIDAYRLEKPEELEILDFESIVSDSHNLVLIEWADNIEEALPLNWKRINFETVSENERGITFA
jgi:tRNA threonylcarbamoyladenosine biosynthesis protein TsaE